MGTNSRNGRVNKASINSTPQKVVASSEQRVVLVFSPPSTGSYTVSTEASITDSGGMVLLAGGGELTITREIHGDAVTKPWYAMTNSAPVPAPTVMGFVEVLE